MNKYINSIKKCFLTTELDQNILNILIIRIFWKRHWTVFKINVFKFIVTLELQ